MTHPYRAVLAARFGGVVLRGSHNPDSQACALEVASIARGKAWSDEPSTAGLPDLRPLNDARWSSDEARTAALVPVVEAYWAWPEWTRAQQSAVMKRVAELTIRRVLPVGLRAVGLHAAAERCEREGTAAAAAAAARAAAYAADDYVLQIACALWIEAAEVIR